MKQRYAWKRSQFILYFEATGIKLIHDYHILRNTKLLEYFQKLAGLRYKVFNWVIWPKKKKKIIIGLVKEYSILREHAYTHLAIDSQLVLLRFFFLFSRVHCVSKGRYMVHDSGCWLNNHWNRSPPKNVVLT